ncbi:hypothetical protein A2U01_0013929 [Trifolium medium]|uniref:Uncharacterized protein n=1 Tax=Trifolium medium TaxID=97028 RepID=A0A392N075_9FABA|nr:hypothetical protein [Trifolium medium]
MARSPAFPARGAIHRVLAARGVADLAHSASDLTGGNLKFLAGSGQKF